jgi:hypothetical protein
MVFNFRDPIPAEPHLLLTDQPMNQINDLIGQVHIIRKHQILLMVLDFVVNLLITIRRKRGIADQHLIQDDSDGPPIHGLSVSRLSQHFRRDVVGCAHCAVGQLPVSLVPPFDFGQVFQVDFRFGEGEL